MYDIISNVDLDIAMSITNVSDSIQDIYVNKIPRSFFYEFILNDVNNNLINNLVN